MHKYSYFPKNSQSDFTYPTIFFSFSYKISQIYCIFKNTVNFNVHKFLKVGISIYVQNRDFVLSNSLYFQANVLSIWFSCLSCENRKFWLSFLNVEVFEFWLQNQNFLFSKFTVFSKILWISMCIYIYLKVEISSYIQNQDFVCFLYF